LAELAMNLMKTGKVGGLISLEAETSQKNKEEV